MRIWRASRDRSGGRSGGSIWVYSEVNLGHSEVNLGPVSREPQGTVIFSLHLAVGRLKAGIYSNMGPGMAG